MDRSIEDLATTLGLMGHAGDADRHSDTLKNVGDDAETTPLGGPVSSERLLTKPETVCLKFVWRAPFHQFAPQMAQCVQLVLEQKCNSVLQQEDMTHVSTSNHVPLVPTPPSQDPQLPCPDGDTPRMVAKFCADVVEETDALLPLAVACEDHDLLPVRSSYVEACGRLTSALLARLEKRAEEVPASAPLRNLAALLASSAYLHQRLTHYESQLKSTARTPPRSLTLLPIARSRDVTEALREHLTSYCVNVCATSLLQDAESHHWADAKPFHEGERCSFSIQMWHYFLCGLRSDLWGALSPTLAQDTLAQVLAQTLELLLQRYSRARPSCRRLPQIRADIEAILLCVYRLMWSVCGSVDELVRPDLASGTWMAFIHNMCDQLLGVLVILTAPLKQLYRTFQNGFGEEPSGTAAGTRANCGPIWLNVVNPTLFPQHLLRDPVAGRHRALWLLGLVGSGPGCGPALLLQASLHAEGLLLRTLISHSHLCLDSEAAVSPEARQAADKFVEAVFSVLSSLNSVPRALALVLEDYLDRRHLWEFFCSLAELSVAESPLVPCVRAVVSKPVSCLLRHLVNMMQEHQDLCGPQLRRDLPQDILAKIPSQWKYTPQAPKTDSTALTIQALTFIFTTLPSVVASLPLPIRYLFHVAEGRLARRGRQPRAAGLLPWVLLTRLAHDLKDGRSLQLASTRPLEPGTREILALVSDCLQASVDPQRGVAKPTAQKVLQSLEEMRPAWSSTQLERARRLCAGSVFEQRVEGGLLEERGALSEPTEQKMGPWLLAWCQGTGGSQNLGRIYRTVQLNEGLLRSILTSAEDETSSPRGPPPVLFPASTSSAHGTLPRPFDPFSHFHCVGPATSDQSDVSEKERDWATLLTTYQRTSQVTFTVLLANRLCHESFSHGAFQQNRPD
ncbi:uncharacterized protein KIAA0825 homolog [Brachyhypopomus gauderio]|uniref:uncharacterized protein KIAA0825 homolog n=1 Tax=Brachyhypopomus gauderio TaxID=698409 RepID=UPI0040425602